MCKCSCNVTAGPPSSSSSADFSRCCRWRGNCRLRRGGWLWALFGLYQRRYVDGRAAADAGGGMQGSSPPAHAMTENAGLMRLLACFVAAVVYVWQEQKEFSFPPILFRRRHSRCRRFVPWPVSVPARPEPHPTARDHGRRCCASSAGTPWKFTLSSLPAPNSS